MELLKSLYEVPHNISFITPTVKIASFLCNDVKKKKKNTCFWLMPLQLLYLIWKYQYGVYLYHKLISILVFVNPNNLGTPSTVGSKGIAYIFPFLSLCHPAADAWCKPDEKVCVLNSDSREDETDVRESDHEFHCGCSWVESPRVQLKVLRVECLTVSGAARW